MTTTNPGTSKNSSKSAKADPAPEESKTQAQTKPEVDEFDASNFKAAGGNRKWFKAGQTTDPMIFVPKAVSPDGRVYAVELCRDFFPLYLNGQLDKKEAGKKGDIVFVWAPSSPQANEAIHHAIKNSFAVSYAVPHKESVQSAKLGRKTDMWVVQCGYLAKSRPTLVQSNEIIMPMLGERSDAGEKDEMPF